MNVNCTQCQTVFRVDPAKVPEAGVRARCSVCSGIFWVRREAEAAPRVEAPAPVATPEPVRAPTSPAAPPAAPPATPPATLPERHHTP
ncbi:MAG TPA: zinc-ribbon domain-containing protein, partial [Gemmatimonadales bacterium]